MTSTHPLHLQSLHNRHNANPGPWGRARIFPQHLQRPRILCISSHFTALLPQKRGYSRFLGCREACTHLLLAPKKGLEQGSAVRGGLHTPTSGPKKELEQGSRNPCTPPTARW